MKLVLVQKTDGLNRGKWGWIVEANDGKPIAAGYQTHSTQLACINEIKAVQAGLPITKITERAALKEPLIRRM